MRRALAIALTLWPVAGLTESYPDATRVVSIGGPLTEIVYALGQQDRLIARDTTSTYPEAVNALPDVGYMRQLSAEGVLSVDPDLIIARDTSGPPETLEVLTAAQVPIVLIPDGFDAAAVPASIREVGKALGAVDAAEALARKIEVDLDRIEAQNATLPTKARVMFVLSMEGGRLNVAGSHTGADGIIALAGGENVMAGAFNGYKLVSDEAVIEAAPEIIVMMRERAEHAVTAEQLFAMPAIAVTPAGQARKLVLVEGAALGFGPRTARAATQLHDDLYGETEH